VCGNIIDAQRIVSSGGREVGDLLVRSACPANCDILEDGLNRQRALDSLSTAIVTFNVFRHYI
jgi:hypothetical protein